MKVLIFGCGFIGFPVARRLIEAGNRVFAVTRSAEKAARLQQIGVAPIQANWMDRRSLVGLPSVDAALIAVGYDRSCGLSQREVYVEGLRNALGSISPAAKLIYCSSTGVYHQSDGCWVDETSPTHPEREGGRAHLAAEQLLWRLRPEQPTVILRLAGLYGPQRVPRIVELKAGNPLPVAADSWLNLIHQVDVVSGIIAAWHHPQPDRLYVVSDGKPVKRADYYRTAATLWDAPEPLASSTVLDLPPF